MDEIFKLLGRHNSGSFKKLGNNPKALTKFIFVSEILPQIDKFYVTDKADGQRAFLISRENGAKYLVAGATHQISKLPFTGIFDCELIGSDLYVFDVLQYNGENISKLPFERRLAYLERLPQIGCVKVKKYTKLTTATYAHVINTIYTEKRPYKVDGLIFTKAEGLSQGRSNEHIRSNYMQTINLKWKPPSQLTIDFFYLGGVLHVGIDQRSWKQYGFPLPANYQNRGVVNGVIVQNYFPVPFICSLGDFSKFSHAGLKDGAIVELSWANGWKFHRTREDREVELAGGHYYGNNYRVAEQTMQAVLNPLEFKDLLSSKAVLSRGFYFQKKDEAYLAMRKFNNFVKNNLIKGHTARRVMDLGSGKGQDLQKYVGARVSELLMIELDANAIDEIIQRKYDICGQIPVDKAPPRVTDRPKFILHIRRLDLNNTWKKNISALDGFRPDAIFCNLALHYLMWNKDQLANICGFIAHFLPVNGEFVFTALDGACVFELLTKGPYKTEKYLIERLGEWGPKFRGFEKILVQLPCADEPREEPLINLFEVDKAFSKYGLVRTSHEIFAKSLDAFARERPKFFGGLTADDLRVAQLYSSTIYRKIKSSSRVKKN